MSAEVLPNGASHNKDDRDRTWLRLYLSAGNGQVIVAVDPDAREYLRQFSETEIALAIGNAAGLSVRTHREML